ncbi:4Fe-4S cluster-binding domain-containing protein [Streptomyces sp. TRM68367]|nr:4Fe-4S cluster-binding domain-containing protein [Streptomyces sp. TRM68367]
MIGRAPNNAREVLAVEDAGHGEVVALTTSTGNYIAEGWLVHNCDTPYTWDASRFDLRKELTRRPVEDLVPELLDGDPEVVVITGGEPLLQQKKPGWQLLLDRLTAAGVDIEVETNGTIPPTPYTAATVTRFNVSPKLAHAGDPEHKRINGKALAVLRWTGRASFKFVCATEAHVQEVARLCDLYGIPPRLVWAMSEGTTPQAVTEHLATIADPAIAAGFNLTTRLHVLAWGDERGR